MRRFYQVLSMLFLFVSCRQENNYTVSTSVEPGEGGTIVMTPSSGSVVEGTVVSFKANPNGDYVFTGWSGSVSGTENPKTVTVTSDLTVIANFALREYPLSIIVEGEGSVSERVISAKADYASGTVVELTALPATGWSFDHWEGDLTGADNPITITISSAKTVKAVFTKNHYAYNLKIVGPGVVDEYLVENTKATLEYGTKVHLKAIPAKGAIFKNWSGSRSEMASEIFVDMESAKEITATFELDDEFYRRPLISLNQPSSMTKRLYYGLDFSTLSYFPTGFIPVDYDQDGFIDVITCHGDYENNGRLPMVFYKGPYFTLDEKNCDKYPSLLGIRKSFAGDFNGDGRTDICFVGHGNEAFPNPKDYPILLFGKDDNTFEWMGVEECFGYHHGSAAGDIDNDGDLDVVLLGDYPELCIMVNDGTGRFTRNTELINYSIVDGSMYTCELYDLNHDGFLDLIVGGHEHEGMHYEWWGQYKNPTYVFWGNGQTFNHSNYVCCPRFKDGYGVTLDYLFYDLDEDGQEEIINVRTGDGLYMESYRGWAIQILSFDGTSFFDVTSQYVNDSDNGASSGDAVIWIDMEEIDGEMFLCGRIVTNAEKLFRLDNGRLIRVQKELYPTLEAGFPILTEERTMHQGWQQYASIVIGFEDGLDLSQLVSEDYCLELYIKNTDPTLTFDYHFDLFSVLQPNGDCRIYGTGTDMKNMKNDGSWERLCIPLKQFDLWGEGPNENYWNKVDQFVLITTSHGGEEFSVKDIRIRKVLPE